MTQPGSERVLQILVREKYITETMCTLIDRYTTKWQVSAYDAVLDTSLLTESELAHAMASTCHIPRIYSLKDAVLAREAVKVIPFERARAKVVLPIKLPDGRIELVLTDPTRVEIIEELEEGLGVTVKLAVAERSEITRAIDLLYPIACGWEHCKE